MSTEFPLINGLQFVESSSAISLMLYTDDITLEISTELYNDDLRDMVMKIQYIIDIDILYNNKAEKQKATGKYND